MRLGASARIVGLTVHMKRLSVILILLLAFCGLADSVYLTQHEMSGTPLLCTIQNLSGCNVVAQSAYSRIFGIPVSEYGLAFYGVVFVVAALELALFDRRLRRFLQGLSFVGLIASLLFTAVQVFVINALCIYCLGSAIISLLIFAFAFFVEPLSPGRAVPEEPPKQLPMPPSA